MCCADLAAALQAAFRRSQSLEARPDQYTLVGGNGYLSARANSGHGQPSPLRTPGSARTPAPPSTPATRSPAVLSSSGGLLFTQVGDNGGPMVSAGGGSGGGALPPTP